MEMPHKIEVLWCRIFQGVLKIGNYFMGYRMPKYLEGPGKIKELGAFLKEKRIDDVLVVTGSGMARRGQVQVVMMPRKPMLSSAGLKDPTRKWVFPISLM